MLAALIEYFAAVRMVNLPTFAGLYNLLSLALNLLGMFGANHPMKFFPNFLSNAVNGPDTLSSIAERLFSHESSGCPKCVPTSLQMT